MVDRPVTPPPTTPLAPSHGIDEFKDLEIFEHPADREHTDRVLSRLESYLQERTTHHLGYPYNLRFDYVDLQPFLQFSINNLGDPFVESNYGVHVCSFERAVLRFFAKLWGIGKDDFWGYITTCGTEGNLLGILYGREKCPDGVLYCSREAHYSVAKAGTMFRIPVEIVATKFTGEMDYDDLERCLRKHPGKSAIVGVAMGTTVKGAYDSVDDVIRVVKKCGLSRDRFYVHVDGALNALILPFLDDTVHRDLRKKQVTFEKEIDSVSVSGHKMLGCPMPCGVVITRKEHMERWGKDIEYLNSTDTTITGSRNGQAALAMWVALQRKGLNGFRDDVLRCVENALYLKDLLDKSGISVLVNEFSTTVVFERPPDHMVRKWQLACVGGIAHIVVMPNVTREKLAEFVEEFNRSRQALQIEPSSVYEWIGPNCKVYQKKSGVEWVSF